ncbi:hypothetical protein BUALT_Bualt02G0106600 [Buddleja alternifolia]|uniref:Uncharacterized protein n=1 Tax=Buddleja alternifolia TaxID=168488 RepID=A0AAV6Y0I4_9LAMI|nr:hypothetical protein BUALT_Bualt02G0106600 [Buddleja alternifolia]
MSSFHPKLSLSQNSNFDEQQWVIQIRRTLDEDIDEEDTHETPVHIFTVPKSLMAIHPDSYTPQQVAIGPYHYTRPEIHDMERYKIAAAKRNQKDFKSDLKLQRLVDILVAVEPKIRACYHKFLTFNGETLAWMMAVDASFLLEFLQVCAVKQGKAALSSINVGSRLSHLVDLAGNKAAHNAILRDISMLENQIPLFVLRKLLEFQLSSSEKGEEMLFAMLIGFCQELSPFKRVEDLLNINVQVMEWAHLLDVLYHFCVPKLEGGFNIVGESVQQDGDETKEEEDQVATEISDEQKDFLHKVWTKVSNIQALADFTKKIIFSKPVKVIIKLPWILLSKIPMLKVIKETMEKYFPNHDEENEEEGESGNADIINKHPVLEEITIPSVTELAKAGVRFQPAAQGISAITFDDKTLTFYLPIISLDVNSEVVLRNLVAYEACKASGPLVLARYTELMNGIIDTEDDAKFLRENGIIVNRLKSDEEVANLWNGMSKSIRLTKVPFLDKVIEDVNKFYTRRWRVKLAKCMRRYVFESWRILTFLAAILMIVLMGLQAFCSVYSCSRVVPIDHLN